MPALIDVADVGPGVTTNPTVIRSFLNSDGPRLVFATYQSSAQIAKAMATDCAVFDIAILHEADWCAGLAGRSNKTIDEDKIRAREASVFHRYSDHLPATRDCAGRSKADDGRVDGRYQGLWSRALSTLIRGKPSTGGLLCPYQVVVMPVSDREVQELIEQHKIVTTDGGDTPHRCRQSRHLDCMSSDDARFRLPTYGRVPHLLH